MRVRFLLIALVVLIIVTGCDSLFSTREAESPSNSQSSWIPALTPEQVILNLQNAIYERSLENFKRCLIDSAYSQESYQFHPDPQVGADYSSIFTGWDQQKEETVMKQAFSLIPAGGSSFLVFSEDSWQVYSSAEAVYSAEYRLELHHTQVALDSVFRGNLIYTIKPDSRGEWSIQDWVDNGVSGSSSWSLLKALLGG